MTPELREAREARGLPPYARPKRKRAAAPTPHKLRNARERLRVTCPCGRRSWTVDPSLLDRYLCTQCR